MSDAERANDAEAWVMQLQVEVVRLQARITELERQARITELERLVLGLIQSGVDEEEERWVAVDPGGLDAALEEPFVRRALGLGAGSRITELERERERWDEGPCYICGKHVSPAQGWHREDHDGTRRHWCPDHQPVWSRRYSPPDAVAPIIAGDPQDVPDHIPVPASDEESVRGALREALVYIAEEADDETGYSPPELSLLNEGFAAFERIVAERDRLREALTEAASCAGAYGGGLADKALCPRCLATARRALAVEPGPDKTDLGGTADAVLGGTAAQEQTP